MTPVAWFLVALLALGFAALWRKAWSIGEDVRRAKNRDEIWLHSHDRGQP